MLRKFAMGMVVLLLSAVLISGCVPTISSTPTSQPTTDTTATPSPIPTLTSTGTLTPNPTATKTATPTTTPTQTPTATATATETPISPDQLALELGWLAEEGPYSIQDTPVGRVMMGSKGVMGYEADGRWKSTNEYWRKYGSILYSWDDPSSDSYSLFGVGGEIIEEDMPIPGNNNSTVATSIFSYRHFFIDYSRKKMSMVNLVLLAQMPDGRVVVMENTWDLLGEIGGANYDLAYLENFFSPKIKENWVISAIFYSKVEEFDRHIDKWVPRPTSDNNSGLVAKISREFLLSGKGNDFQKIRSAENNPGEMLIPFTLGSSIFRRIRY